MENQTQKPHLSWSQLNTFLMCGRRYWYDRIVKVPFLTTSALFFGSRCHDAEEFNYRQKIQSDVDLPVEQVVEFFINAWDTQIGNEEVRFEPNESSETLRAIGESVIRAHMKDIAPSIHPLYVEYPPRVGADTQRISLGDNFPFTFQGHFDIVERDPENPELPGGFSDHKHYAARKARTFDVDIHDDDQYTVYALMYRILFGRVEKSIHANVVTKDAKAIARRVPTKRDEERIRWFLGTIEEAGRSIDAGIYVPRDNGWWCSQKWCAHWGLCKDLQTWRKIEKYHPELALQNESR